MGICIENNMDSFASNCSKLPEHAGDTGRVEAALHVQSESEK